MPINRHLLPRLDQLVENSAGSQLISYAFENRVVRFQIYHEAYGELLTFQAKSDTVYGRSVPSDPHRSRCRIVLTELPGRLFVKDGKYVPSTEPEIAILESRSHYNLAYGRRTSDVRWMLTLEGEYNLLCFLMRDLAELQWATD